MEDTGEHPLLTRFPEDANWEEFDNLTLRRQCLVRNIPNDQTTRDYKIRVLKDYQKTHVTKVRKIPWCGKPDSLSWEEEDSRLGISDDYYIVQVKDRSSSNGTDFTKDFTFCDAKGWTCIVAFQEIPTCTCRLQDTYSCVHIMYLLRFVLSCPEHLLWQAAFLPSEVEIIYRHSRALRALLPTDNKAEDITCVICFKSNTQKKVTSCSTCDRAVHRDCLKLVLKVRKPKPPGSCWMCEDSSEWDIEKYRQQNQVPAATSTSTIYPSLFAPTENSFNTPFGRKGRISFGVKSDSSPKNQVHRDAQVSDNPETDKRPSYATMITEKDGMSEDGSVDVKNESMDKLNGEDDVEGELEQEQDEDNDVLGDELDNKGNVGVELEREQNEDIEMSDWMEAPPQLSPSLSSSSGFPPHSQFTVDKQGLLTLPNARHPSRASKGALPRRMNLTPMPIIPFQRSASLPITSNLEPMSLKLKQQREQEKSEKQPRGVSLDFNLALANSRTPVPSVGFTSLKSTVTPADALGQDGQTPPPSAVGIDSQDSVSATAAATAQTTTSNPLEGSPGVADGYSPVSTAGDVRQRTSAKLMRKFRRLEKETSYIGKRAERGIKSIHREYKRELKVLKEKRKKLEKRLRDFN